MATELSSIAGRPPRGPLRWRWLNHAATAIIRACRLTAATDNIEIVETVDGIVVRNKSAASAAVALPDAFDPYQDANGRWTLTSGNYDFNEGQRTVADAQLIIDGEYLPINSSAVSISGTSTRVLGIYFRLKFLDPFYTDAPAHVSDTIGWSGSFGTHMELYLGENPELRAVTPITLASMTAAQVDTGIGSTAQRIGEYFIPLAIIASGHKSRLWADSGFSINVEIGFGNYRYF